MAAVVSIEGLSKRYGRRLAVDGVSLEVHDREVVGLLGPNGSGKTTILRILTGYLRPSAGAVRVDGLDIVTEGHLARGRIGYVPENAPLYAHMRVSEFLAFMGRLRGLEPPVLHRRLESVRERLSLGPVGEVVIGRLSRGYRQRVSIAQAMLHQPKLLVLDEPTNGLDPRQVIELRGLLRTLAQDCAVLVTSHILAEMERIADRVAILLNGRLLAVHRISRPGHAVSFRIRAPTDAAPGIATALSTAAATASTTREPADGDGMLSWRVTTTEPDGAARVVAALCAAGVASIEPVGAASDLEALFLRLTAEEAVH